MIRSVIRLTMLLLLLLISSAHAQKWVNISTPWSLVERNPAVDMIDDTIDSFVYGTERGFLYFMERDILTGRIKTTRQREVWAPVKEIRVADCTGNTRPNLVVTTRRGDLFVINLDNMKDIWRLQEGKYQDISTFTVANVDEDPKPEIIMIADGHLVIMTGDEEIEEFSSSEEYTATMIRVADVDADGHDEIVLNTGHVLDAQFRQLEWEFEGDFGQQFDILDIDGDGKLEIVCTLPGVGLQIIDADERRIKWE
ncbi:MAG: hypothetical protein GY835_14850 [bacterium]|nr:hypothetical protein [bacterium]